jgi:hypothetical protein
MMSIWMKLFTVAVTTTGLLAIMGAIVAGFIAVHRPKDRD